MAETMREVATIPCGVVFPNLTTRDHYVGKTATYSNVKLTQWPVSTSASTTDGTAFVSDMNAGEGQVTSAGNIWSTTKGNGLYVNRAGTKSASSVQVEGPTGWTGGTELSGGIWDTTSASTHLPWIIGLSWRYYHTGAHSGTKCAYPTKVALLYTDAARNRKSFNLSVKAHANSYELGEDAHDADSTDGGYYAYTLDPSLIATVCDTNNPLFFMGVAVEWAHKHGTGSQTLSGTCWNAVPITAPPWNSAASLPDTWDGTIAMCVKSEKSLTASLTSSSTMYELQ